MKSIKKLFSFIFGILYVVSFSFAGINTGLGQGDHEGPPVYVPSNPNPGTGGGSSGSGGGSSGSGNTGGSSGGSGSTNPGTGTGSGNSGGSTSGESSGAGNGSKDNSSSETGAGKDSGEDSGTGSGNSSGSGTSGGTGGSSSGGSSGGNSGSTGGNTGGNTGGHSGSSGGSSYTGPTEDDVVNTWGSMTRTEAEVTKASLQKEVNDIKQKESKAAEKIFNRLDFVYDKLSYLNGIAVEKAFCSFGQMEGYEPDFPEPTAVGDPIMIASGKYYNKDNDFEVSYGSSIFNVTRTHITSLSLTGGFGKGWSSVFDSRIVRGSSDYAQEMYDYNNTRLKYLRAYSPYRSSYYSMISNVESVQKELKKDIDANNSAKEKNKYITTDDFSYMASTGTEWILHVNEEGERLMFKYDESKNKYFPVEADSDSSVWIQKNTSTSGFDVCYKNGDIERYNEWGFPSQFTNRFGSSIEFKYNSSMQLLEVLCSGTPVLKLTWGSGKISSIKDCRTNEIVYYSYSGNKLISVQKNFNSKSYGYDSDGDLCSIVKSDKSEIRIEYGTSTVTGTKFAAKVKTEEGGYQQFKPRDKDGTAYFIDEDGNVTTYRIDTDLHIVYESYPDGSFIQRTFDSKGNLKSVADNFGSVEYIYDQNGRLTSAVYSNGKQQSWSYSNVYDRVSKYVDLDGVAVEYAYDSKGNCINVKRNNETILTAEYNSWGGVSKAEGLGLEKFYSYDDFYRLVSDGITHYSYNAKGKVSSIKYADGTTESISYSQDGLVQTRVNSNGLETIYTYDSRESLIHETQRDTVTGRTYSKRFEYNAMKLPVRFYAGEGTSIEDAIENECLIEYRTYSKSGQLLSAILLNHGAALENDGYGIKKQYTWYLNRLSSYTVYRIDEKQNPLCDSLEWKYSYGYSGNNFIVRESNPAGKITTRYYNRRGDLVKTVYPGNLTEENTYSSGGRKISTKQVDGIVWDYKYNVTFEKLAGIDVSGKSYIQKNYDAQGNLSAELLPTGDVVYYSYDKVPDGIKVKAEGLSGTEERVYNASGILSSIVVYDPDGKIVQNNSMNVSGRTVSINDNGVHSFKTIDAWGRIVYDSQTDMSYGYDFLGNITKAECKSTGYYCCSEYNALGKISCQNECDINIENFHYDASGNLLLKEDKEGDVERIAYDKNLRVIAKWQRGYPLYEYQYNENGLVSEVIAGGISVDKRSYPEGFKTICHEDALGNIWFEEYDLYGTLVKVTDRLGNVMNCDNYIGNRSKTLVDFNGNTTVTELNPANNTLTSSYSDGTKDSVTFDASGKIIGLNSPSSSVVFEYNGKNLSGITNVCAGEYRSISFLTDAESKVIDTGDKVFAYSYDSNGKLKSLSSATLECSYEYDSLGREVKKVCSDGTVETKIYDSASRLLGLFQVDNYGDLLYGEGRCYNENGCIECSVNHRGDISVYEYDDGLHLIKLWSPADSNAAGGISTETPSVSPESMSRLENILSEIAGSSVNINKNQAWKQESFAYDLNGNCVAHEAPGLSETYEYDAENRLLRSVSNGDVTEYSYDKNGNLLRMQKQNMVKTYTYTVNNKMKTCSAQDLVTGQSITNVYGYDSLGRLCSVSDSRGNTVNYIYDGFGYNIFEASVVSKTDESQYAGRIDSDVYRYANPDNFMQQEIKSREEYRSAGNEEFFEINSYINTVSVQKRYFPSANGRTAFMITDLNSYYIFSDDRNNVKQIMNGLTGETINLDYSTTGFTEFESSNKKTTRARLGELNVNGFDFALNGYLYDSVAGLYCNGQRWMDPLTCRFTTSDPSKYGFNWYSYCGGNTVTQYDPSGFETLNPDIRLKMQEVPADALGNAGPGEETIANAGCYITLISGVVNALHLTDYTASDINSCKSYFGSKGTSSASLFDGDSYLDHVCIESVSVAGQKKILKSIQACIDSDETYVLGAELNIELMSGKTSNHFVGITGTMITVDSKNYIEILGTSLNDVIGKRKNWIQQGESIYVPFEDVKNLRIYKLKDCSE